MSTATNPLILLRTNQMKLLALGLTAMFVTGCATVPREVPTTPSRDSLMASYKSAFAEDPAWDSPPIVVDGEIGVVIMESPKAPDEVQNKRVNLEFNYGSTFRDLAYTLSTIGITLATSDDALLDRKLPVVKWNGRLGGYLRAVGGAADLHFIWRGTAYTLEERDRYVVSALQDADFLTAVASDLEGLGIKVKKSEHAGMLVVDAKPSEARLSKTYLARSSKNAAIVSMQIGVVNVQLNGARNVGVDWGRLAVALGDGAAAAVHGTGAAAKLTAGSFKGTTAAVAITRKDFSLGGVVNFLASYGETTTLQNTLLTTIAGKEVNLTSAVNVPYVSSIGVSTGSSTTAATGDGSTTTSTAPIGTTTTTTAKSGVTVKMKPRYDHDSSLVSLDLNLQVSAVLGQNQLSAGNQIGSLTQPTTQDQTFNATLRLRPGETAVVGGVRYWSKKKDQMGLATTKLPLGTEGDNTTINEMFIVVRPTVRLAGKTPGENDD